MALSIFISGISLGFSVGFATMALVAARGLRLRVEAAQTRRGYSPCAHSFTRKFSPSLEARPQASGAYFYPGP